MAKDSRSRKSRSRDRDRRRHRSKSHDRERRGRHSPGRSQRETGKRRRSRSRSRDQDRKRADRNNKKRRRSSSSSGDEVKNREFGLEDYVKAENKEAAEKKLEDEMQKRRERIERWRAEKKAQQEVKGIKQEPDDDVSMTEGKKWTLDDEDEDDMEDDELENSADAAPILKKEKPEETMENFGEPSVSKKNGEVKAEPSDPKEEYDDDLDPLDAFMSDVSKEIGDLDKTKVKKRQEDNVVVKMETKTTENKKVSKVMVVKKMANKEEAMQHKGELMDDQADVFDVSDHEDLDLEGTMSLASKAKQLPQVDHTRVYYRPFRREFYIEVPELAKMTEEEVNAYREELENIKIRGKGCPKPIKTWAQSGCSRTVLDLLKQYGYEKPTPIQAQAIPAILMGLDVIGIAKTGSGKTLSFLIPMFRHILDQPPLDEMDGPIAVILTPTRELAIQINRECKKFATSLGLRSVCVYGGTGISEQIAELKRGTEIIVCTPGRMIDMLAANNGRVTNLRRATFLIMDEADRMFDMGFEPQVMKIVNNVRPDRQTVMFSATFPRQMEALAKKALIKPVEIQVGGRSVVCSDVEQNAIVIDEKEKFWKLLELLGYYYEHGNVLVFVDKQEHADDLIKNLMEAGYPCASLHGGIDQHDRDSIINDFKAGRNRLLVATSVAARGLDVQNLILVVNYDCPNHYEDYVHRVGRTGRAGNKGYSYTFILPTGQERSAGDVCRAFELANQKIPEDLKKLWTDYVEQMKSEGKEIKLGGGFGGHGFKFDANEAEAKQNKRNMEKMLHGLQEGDEEDEEDIDNQINTLLKSTKRITEGKIDRNAGEPAAPKPNLEANKQKVELAKQVALKISKERNLGLMAKDVTQQTAEAVMKGTDAGTVQVSAKTKAQQLAEKLNEKLNYIPQERPPEVQKQEEEIATKYEEELEINDFPQQIRWKITSRETLSAIAETTDVFISVRGTYVIPGKNPPEGERKLFLLLESTSEFSMSRSKIEIVRMIKEEMKRLAYQTGMQSFNRGRYKVV